MATATIARTTPKRAHAPSRTRRDDFLTLLRPANEGTITDSSVVAWIQQTPGTADTIDHDHVRALVAQAQQTHDRRANDTARDELVRLNLRLVFTIATKFQHRGVELQDLMQEGCMGLLRAVDLFDAAQYSNHFSTYCVWWIRCYIGRAITTHRSPIRLPEYAAQHANHILRLTTSGGGMLSDAEIAAELGLPEADVTLLRMVRVPALSLDKEIVHHAASGTYDDDTLYNTLPDENPSTEAAALEALTRSDVQATLREHLSAREVQLVCMRFGLAPYDRVYSLVEVGSVIGVTRERVRQIEAAALDKLRRALSAAQWRELLSSDSG